MLKSCKTHVVDKLYPYICLCIYRLKNNSEPSSPKQMSAPGEEKKNGLAKAKDELQMAEDSLRDVEERMKACKEMMHLAKAGQSNSTQASIADFHQKLLGEECEARVVLERLRKKIAALSEASSSQEDGSLRAPASAVKPVAQRTDERNRPAKRQMTMANFCWSHWVTVSLGRSQDQR